MGGDKTQSKPSQAKNRRPPRSSFTSNHSKLQDSNTLQQESIALDDVPVTCPPVDSLPPTPSNMVTPITKQVPPSSPGPNLKYPRQRKSAISLPTDQGPPPAHPLNKVQEVIDFYENKRSKKGSPPKKKKKTRSSSPDSDDMSTGSKENEFDWPGPHDAIAPPPLIQPLPPSKSHRHLLIPSENFDSESESESITNFMASFDATYPNMSTQGNSTNDSEDYSNHEIPLSQTFHDAQGREYNTATLYNQNGSSPEDPGSDEADHQGQETDRSETPTILASDNDSDHSDSDTSPGHLISSLSPSIPSGSIQYTNPCADSEEEQG
jgi:hypothetical protein